MLFLWRNHGCQLLQIAYHQELHTTKRQIVALAILAKHRIYSIEQIAAHHTDFVDNEQVDTADDIALELAELIAFLFAAAKGLPGTYGEKGSWKNEWMVIPPALMAAMPVGASTIIRFGDSSFNRLRKVVLPVPAFPVRKRLAFVFSMIFHARMDSSFISIQLLFCTRFYIRTRFLLISELDFFRDFAHLLALLLCAWTVFSNMTYRNDYHRLIALASKELLHLRRIVIADPAGTQSLFGGSQTEMLCRYRHINIAMRFLIISAHPVLIHVFIPIIYIGAVLNHSRS